jgi:hypothetical protein
MQICNKCKEKNCKYRNLGFENMTIYCNDHCANKIKTECDQIATPEFREIIDKLNAGNYQLAGVKGILSQAQCILNVADNKIAINS